MIQNDTASTPLRGILSTLTRFFITGSQQIGCNSIFVPHQQFYI
jgi:hypothetical protein